MKAKMLDRADFELCFYSRVDAGRAMAFPCDAEGRVDMDELGRAAFNNYLYARAFVGREFHAPRIRPVCGAGANARGVGCLPL